MSLNQHLAGLFSQARLILIGLWAVASVATGHYIDGSVVELAAETGHIHRFEFGRETRFAKFGGVIAAHATWILLGLAGLSHLLFELFRNDPPAMAQQVAA